MDPETMEKVDADGETLGEVMFRGNIVMKGYLKNRRRPTTPSPAAGSIPAISACCTPTATSSSRTAPRTSSSPAARTSHRSRSRTCSTSTRPSLPRGRRQARREMGRDAVRLRRAQAGRDRDRAARSSPGAARTSPATNARATSCSPSCPRPRPARSRNSSCARWPRPSRPSRKTVLEASSERAESRHTPSPIAPNALGERSTRSAEVRFRSLPILYRSGALRSASPRVHDLRRLMVVLSRESENQDLAP